MITVVLCVGGLYLPIIVCGNGRAQEELEGLSLARGFLNTVNRHDMWDHIPVRSRQLSINSEKRARYDVVEYSSIICYANTSVDPSTGHVLQTIQMI